MSVLWFHGDIAERGTFRDQRWDRPQHEDRNAEGPGIYFTESLRQAKGYGPFVYAARLRPGFKALPRDKPATLRALRKFYNATDPDDRYYFLSNWVEDPDIRRPDDVLRKYVEMGDSLLGALFLLRNDLVQDPSDWIRAALTTGYHGHVVQLPEVRHLVVWDPGMLDLRRIR